MDRTQSNGKHLKVEGIGIVRIKPENGICGIQVYIPELSKNLLKKKRQMQSHSK